MHNTPDWHAAAQTLVNSFHALDTAEDRLNLTEQLCDALGGNLYPAFLQILLNVEQYADNAAKQLITSTLIFGLNTGRLPTGKLSAWGSGNLSKSNAFGRTRTLGPVEYICAWYAQPTAHAPLTQVAFRTMAASLLRLVESDPTAKSLYCTKLLEEAADPLGGSLSRQARTALGQLATRWSRGETPETAVETFIETLSQNSGILEDLSLALHSTDPTRL